MRLTAGEGDGAESAIYRAGGDIPLCDQETQEKFDRLLQGHPYFLRGPGEVIYDTQG